MTPADLIAERLQAAGRAHHEAFIETDGDDPEWAEWYADHLLEDLSNALGVALTANELATTLSELARQHGDESPDELWHGYYARELLARYRAR
jgi:hypothetical protein